jgi:hypothetical protein
MDIGKKTGAGFLDDEIQRRNIERYHSGGVIRVDTRRRFDDDKTFNISANVAYCRIDKGKASERDGCDGNEKYNPFFHRCFFVELLTTVGNV